MRIFLSFDDGRIDAYESAFMILKNNDLPASFHITTGFVDGTYVTDGFGVGRKPVTVDMLREMASTSCDISSHGDKHVAESKDYRISLDKLTEWGLCDGRAGLAVPNSAITDDELKTLIEDNKEQLRYVRVGRSPRCYSFFHKVAFVLYRFTGMQGFFNFFNKPNIESNDNPYKIHSLVVRNSTKARSLIRFIQKNKDKNANLVIMLHSIVNESRDVWEWPASSFEELVIYLSQEQKSGSLKVCTLKEF